MGTITYTLLTVIMLQSGADIDEVKLTRNIRTMEECSKLGARMLNKAAEDKQEVYTACIPVKTTIQREFKKELML